MIATFVPNVGDIRTVSVGTHTTLLVRADNFVYPAQQIYIVVSCVCRVALYVSLLCNVVVK